MSQMPVIAVLLPVLAAPGVKPAQAMMGFGPTNNFNYEFYSLGGLFSPPSRDLNLPSSASPGQVRDRRAAYKRIKTLSLKKEFGTTQDWHVTAYQPEGTDAGIDDISAKLCFWILERTKTENCTEITSASDNNTITYHYQTVEELLVIPTPHILKFVASYSGGGSGQLRQVSFWEYDRDLDSFQCCTALITLSEQGDYELFSSGVLKGSLVTADAYWEAGEGHFAPHHFYVEVYKYATEAGYQKVLGYLTPVKYRSFDDTGEIDVISQELPRIKKLLPERPLHGGPLRRPDLSRFRFKPLVPAPCEGVPLMQSCTP